MVLLQARNLSAVSLPAESARLPSTTPAPAPGPTPAFCLTSDGRRYEEGDGWHDGCRDCYCHAGREMCLLISCPVPSCPHPVVRSDQCCPTCEGTSSGLGPVVLPPPPVAMKTVLSARYLQTRDSTQSFEECLQLLGLELTPCRC